MNYIPWMTMTLNNTYDEYYFAGENSTNQTQPLGEFFGPQYHRTARMVIIGGMILISVIGNSAVCVRLLCGRRRLSKPQVLFLNLAVADLLVTLITMTAQLVWEMMGRLWIAGDIFCRLFKVLQTFALVSSTYMLVVIAIDRYYAIVRPLTPSPRSGRLAFGAWVISLLPSMPNLYVFRQIETGQQGERYCASLFYTGEYPAFHRQAYMAFVFLSIFILPFFLLVGLYVRILAEIWRQSSAIHRSRNSSALPKAKVKTLKLATVIFSAFIVTNLPYVVQEMVLAFAPSSYALDVNVVALFGVISASNSALNPYIYLAFQSRAGLIARFRTLMKNVRSSSSSLGHRLSLTVRSSLPLPQTTLTSCACRNSSSLHPEVVESPKIRES